MARWVVFGGTGYIGSALCSQLVSEREAVVSVSRAVSGPNGCEHRTINMATDTDLESLFQAGDKVVYAAGLASRKACEFSPQLAQFLNCDSPLLLLRAADAARVDSFTYLSSVKARTPPTGIVACEGTGQPAVDTYGRSKWLAEQKLLSFSGYCRVNVIRPATVYGCNVNKEPVCGLNRKLQPLLRFLGLSRVVLPASGRRAMVHIGDLVAAILAVSGEASCDRQVYIAAEPYFYDVAAIASVLSGRQVRSSHLLTRCLLSPLRPLGRMPIIRRILEIESCELYSAARLRGAVNWKPRTRYLDYLRASA
ncbi:hypothetical protein Maes01_01917 [Microbulbifer aestuariivivens]|uniref:NAD-dependent epimerase/dehydratase domain-containing protein n=1 Tax=Microbulbifer aestuariivivens TaxID=1908308 RepID=A0ABP9WQ73_9GAMM